MPLKVDWPFPPAHNVPKLWIVASRLTCAAVGFYSKLWAEWLNTVTAHNKQALLDAVERRPKSQPLLTVSNHHSCLDDPVLWGVLRTRYLVRQNQFIRWTTAASDICFTKKWHARFFSLGRTVPVVRGDGVYQHSMDFILDRLNEGSWVHFFPEGAVNLTHEWKRLKWGIGRLIAECKALPLVVPIWHLGMDSVLPNRSPYIPRIGKKVTMLVGEPIEVSHVVQRLLDAKAGPVEMRKAITDHIQEALKEVKANAEKIHFGITKER